MAKSFPFTYYTFRSYMHDMYSYLLFGFITSSYQCIITQNKGKYGILEYLWQEN